jgi:hypothetical protein
VALRFAKTPPPRQRYQHLVRAIPILLFKLGESEKRLVELRLWPADTLQQARSFYSRPETVERVLKLQNEGWKVSPNFHFGFMASGCCWTNTTVPAAEYMKYWLEHINDTAQIERSDWDEYWRKLVNLKIAASEDREDFDLYFTSTARAFAAPRPGVRCTFLGTSMKPNAGTPGDN